MADFGDVFARLQARAAELARTTAAQRIEKIQRLYQVTFDLRAEVGEAGLKEVGLDTRNQLMMIKPAVVDAVKNLANWMQPEEAEPNDKFGGRRGYIHYEPKGVILHLSTWNAPVLISLGPVVTMMAAGNAVVLKPSEVAPHSAEVVRRIVERAGLTEDIVVVTGGPEVAQALLKLPFNHISYVGNNRVGRLVMEAAAQNFAGVTLEMGGKNPIVIDADADLEAAAGRIVFGRHILAGQACLCPDYIMVDERVKTALVDRLIEKIRAFYDPQGRGFAVSPDLGRIINVRHAERIKGLLDDAASKGARTLIGGGVSVEDRLVEPTILDGVTEEMEIFQEEVFGPVLTIHGYATREEALREIEKRTRPLGLYVFTRSRETAQWWIDHTRAGSSAVNNIAVQATVPTLPFGGSNHSGIGRVNGRAGFREMSNGRGVVEEALDDEPGPPMMFPPFPVGDPDRLDPLIAPIPA
jgi:aldehyde dehydrogenase (NAD+)